MEISNPMVIVIGIGKYEAYYPIDTITNSVHVPDENLKDIILADLDVDLDIRNLVKLFQFLNMICFLIMVIIQR